jgi:hypothetical protein
MSSITSITGYWFAPRAGPPPRRRRVTNSDHPGMKSIMPLQLGKNTIGLRPTLHCGGCMTAYGPTRKPRDVRRSPLT